MIPEYLDIPIFPLPNVTFFPHTYLPLHVFEPRYRAMTANCLAGDRLMGVSLLKEGWQKDYFGRPPLCKTFGVGKIVDVDRMEDGRYNIVLQGLYRVRLVEEFPTSGFRTGRVRVHQDPAIDGRREQIAELMKEIRELTDQLGRLLPDVREVIQTAWAAHPHPLVVIYHLTATLVIDAYDRQSILEEDDPLRRLKLLRVQIHAIVHQLLDRQLREEVVDEE
jgi:Lon protease-like protein